MTPELDTQSKKTSDRIEAIKEKLKLHRKNIKLLTNFVDGEVKPLKSQNTNRVVSHTSIPKNEKQYCWTLQNIQDQILHLEHELTVLTEYGV
jgi:hypothetical protein